MNPFTLLLKPRTYFTSLETHSTVKKGMAVFSLATLTQALASLYYLSSKTTYEIALGQYSVVEITLFGWDYIVMSSLTTVFVALVILLGVGRIFGRFLGRTTPSMKTFINAVFHLFIILAVVNAIFVVFAAPAPAEEYYIFGVELTDVVFHNVSLSWINTDNVRVSMETPILYAKKANITRVHFNQSVVQSGGYTAEEINRLLDETRLEAKLFQPSAPPNTLPQTIEVETLVFKNLEAKNIVLTSVAAVKEGPGTYLVQLILVRGIIWRLLTSVYLGLCVYFLHSTSRKASLLVMVISYLAVTNLVPTLI